MVSAFGWTSSSSSRHRRWILSASWRELCILAAPTNDTAASSASVNAGVVTRRAVATLTVCRSRLTVAGVCLFWVTATASAAASRVGSTTVNASGESVRGNWGAKT